MINNRYWLMRALRWLLLLRMRYEQVRNDNSMNFDMKQRYCQLNMLDYWRINEESNSLLKINEESNTLLKINNILRLTS